MGYQATGTLAKVVSVTDATDLKQVLVTACKLPSGDISFDSPTEDVSGDGETVTKKVIGLPSGVFNFRGVYPKASTRMGNTGLLSFATAGYATYVNSWKLDFDFGELDITAFAATGPTAMLYRPAGRVEVKGSYTAHVDSGAALAAPNAVNGIGATNGLATFKMTEDATDPAFTSLVLVNDKKINGMGDKGLMSVTYGFDCTDTVTAVAGSTLAALLPAGAVDAADWDLDGDGVPDVELVLQTATASRTYTGKAFLRSLSVECTVGKVISVTGSVRFSGAVTLA